MVIFAFSAQPAAGLPNTNWLVQKGAPLAEYAILAVLVGRALLGHGLSPRASAWLAWISVIGYALTDEYHQAFVPGRNAALGDVAIDALGGAIGILLGITFLNRRHSAE